MEVLRPLQADPNHFHFIGDRPLVLPKTQEKVDADLLLGKVWEALPPEAQNHLGRCTVITIPAPWDAVLVLQTTEGTAARLVETGMLSPFQPFLGTEDWWAPHRLVAEEAQRRWTGEPRDANRLLGEWYAQKYDEEEEDWQLWAAQAVQHLTEAGEGDGAWPVARSLVIYLRRGGRYREALPWVQRVLAAAPTGPRLGNALAFQSQLCRLASVVPENAAVNLQHALGLVEPEDRAFVLGEFGSLAWLNGELQEAADYFEKSVQAAVAQQGEISRAVAAALHELAGVLQDQGDLDNARRNLERSLQIKAKLFDTDIHLEVAASLHQLAGVLLDQGDLDAARQNLERSLQIKNQVLGTDIHPEVAASLHTLAVVLLVQGDLDAARQNLERALQIKAQVYGTDIHPDVAVALHHLADVLLAQGDLGAARKTYERTIEIKDAVYGTREHHLTAITEESLGYLLLQQGEIEAGAKLLAHAYGVFQRVLPNHPYTRQLAELFEKESS